MESLLKWAGSKRWQVPALLNVWKHHDHRRLVEPFCGGMNVGLGLNPHVGLFNDANPHVINFYQQVQKGSFNHNDHAWTLSPDDYYAHRAAFNQAVRDGYINTVTTAEYFYALNHWCFNGLCRFNSKGEFNTPARPTLRPLPRFDAAGYRAAMTGWEFTSTDWRKVAFGADDFVYADPPYDDGFTSYTAGGFTWDDQRDLAVHLSAHPGPVILMNKATERIVKLYDALGYTVTLLESKQRMHLSRGRTDAVIEVMATNPTVDARDIMEIT